MDIRRITDLYRKGGIKTLLSSGISYSCMLIKIGFIKRVMLNGNVRYRDIYVDEEVFNSLNLAIQRAIINESMDIGTIKLIYEYIPQQTPVIELGGGIGIVSCHIDNHVNHNNILILEPNARVVGQLETNKKLNDANFKIINKAYDPTNNSLELNVGDAFWGASTNKNVDECTTESIEVEGVSISSLLRENNIDKFSLVANAEGAEYDLLHEEMEILKKMCEIMIVGFHDVEQYNINKTISHIQDNGFNRIEMKGNRKVLFKNSNITN